MDVVDNNDSPTGPDPQARLGRDGRGKSAQPIPCPIRSSKSYTDESLEESLLTGESDTMVGVATSGEPEPGERRSMTDDRVNTREVQSAEENLETHEDDAVTLSDVSSIKAVRTLNDPKEPQQASSPIVDLSEGPLAFILHLSLHESGRAVDEHMPSSELAINVIRIAAVSRIAVEEDSTTPNARGVVVG